MSNYLTTYQESIAQPEHFWAEQMQQIDWYKQPEQILQKVDEHHYQWFADGELNTAHLALDYHIAQGRGEQPALIYDSPVTNTIKTFTYSELCDRVARLAGGLRQLGVGKGDTVVIYMPMIPEAAMAMLACARLGAVHSVVFGGFAPHELAIRIDDAKPKVLMTASCGIEVSRVIAYQPLVEQALKEAKHQPDFVVYKQRAEQALTLYGKQEIDFDHLFDHEPVAPVAVKSTDPLYILYTSGTTGKPKGIVRDNGGHAVALKYSMKYVYGVAPGEVYWAASDVGWVVGHSYIVYAPLIHGCTTILFEGKPIKAPDPGVFWRIIEQHQVQTLFTAPTAFRAIKKEDQHAEHLKKHDVSCLRNLFLAGERTDPATYEWAKNILGIPVIDHWWQTETGWPIVANMLGLEAFPVKPGSATKPVSGYEVHILDEAGHELGPNEEGYIAIKLPLPPGCLPTLWKDDERFVSSYLSLFPGYYATGDGGYMDEEGYVYIMGRVDDVINVAGHRLSTGEIEEVIAEHEAVAECAVIGVNDELKGQIPVGIAVLKDGLDINASELEAELVKRVRDTIGAITCLKQVHLAKRLPKTRSGKTLRKTMRKIANGEHYDIPSTIDDPSILAEIEALIKQ